MKYCFLICAIFLLMFPTTSYAKISNTNELISAMIFMVDGKVVTTEKYSEIRADVKLDAKTVRSAVLDHSALEGVSVTVQLVRIHGRVVKI